MPSAIHTIGRALKWLMAELHHLWNLIAKPVVPHPAPLHRAGAVMPPWGYSALPIAPPPPPPPWAPQRTGEAPKAEVAAAA